MTIKIVTEREQKSSSWSGGTTSELFIYPPSAEYGKRDFLFRLSTATVEAEESVFTPLSGFMRQLMVLEGEFLVTHKNHYEITLRRFDTDEFDGAWETHARGRVVDFNLMLSPQANGSIRHLTLSEDKTFSPDFHAFGFIYVYEGQVTLPDGLVAVAKDFIVVRNSAHLALKATTAAELVIAEVQLVD